MKVGITVGPPHAQFSAPLNCQKHILEELRKMDTGIDLVGVHDKVPRGLDLLHMHNLPFRSVEWLRARKAPHVIAHAHGNLLWCHPELMTNRPIDRLRMKSWAYMSRRHIDAYLAVSHYLSFFLGSWGVKPDRLRTVYNGIEPVFFEKANGRPPVKGPYILHVSSYQPKKNTESLIKAFPLIRREFPNHRLVVTGPGHMGAASGAAAEGMKGVQFLGKVSNECLHRLYGDAALFVFPTLHETFGLPAVEAMAMGCPVLTTRRGSMPEVCGEGARYCSPEPDSIARHALTVLGDASLRRTLRKQGRARAKVFTWERAAKDVLRAYEEVLG